MAVTLPYTLTPDTNADATQVMANFNALREALEGIGGASTASDVYQAGVLTSTDWIPSGGGVTGGTGEIKIEGFGGAAWLPAPGGGLVRTFTTPATYEKLKPPALPASGGYRCIAEEIAASGDSAVVTLTSGTEQVSEAAALAAPPATTAGKMQVRNFVLHNTAGTYSIGGLFRDRRPWARGANAFQKRTSGTITAGEGLLDATNLALRIECTGVPVILSLHVTVQSTSGVAGMLFGFQADATNIDGMGKNGIGDVVVPETNATAAGYFSWTYVPAAGSHLFQPTMFGSAANAQVLSSVSRPIQFSVREDVRPSASNGTA